MMRMGDEKTSADVEAHSHNINRCVYVCTSIHIFNTSWRLAASFIHDSTYNRQPREKTPPVFEVEKKKLLHLPSILYCSFL
uniref:Ovule protein n=1 Tax=Strongyloides venezuelensis TaxID=75913 RepID=A0A0K0F0Y6_STRVS